MKIKACLSHITDEWRTPTKIYNYFMDLGYIDTFKYKQKTNQFEIMYENQKIYMNPPFSKLKDIPNYIKKLLEKNNEVILLMPARTDTKYFHQLLQMKPLITFIKGRLKFNDKGTAPFPTILLKFYRWSLFTIWTAKEQYMIEKD